MSKIRKPIDLTKITPIPNSLYRMGNRVGSALWLCFWCIDRTTEEYIDESEKHNTTNPRRTGVVLGGDVFSDSDVSGDITRAGYKIGSKTIQRWRTALCKANFIRAKRSAYGYSYEVLDSHKGLPLKTTKAETNVSIPVSSEDEQQRHNAATAMVKEAAQQKADEEYLKKANQREFAIQATQNFRALPQETKKQIKDFIERCRNHWDYVRSHWDGQGDDSETPIPKEDMTIPVFHAPSANEKLRLLQLVSNDNWEPVFHQWTGFPRRQKGFVGVVNIWSVFLSHCESINLNRACEQETGYEAERQQEKDNEEEQDRKRTLRRLESERAAASA